MKRWRKVRLSERGVYEPDLSEEQILRIIVDQMWWTHRIRLYRINCPVGGKVRPNERGIPDLIGYFSREGNAVPIFIEVKRPGGKRRPEQVKFIADAKAAGCLALFADSWDDVESELREAR